MAQKVAPSKAMQKTRSNVPLTGVDKLLFLTTSAFTPMVTNCMFLCEPTIVVRKVKRNLDFSRKTHARMRQRVVNGAWVNCEMNIDDHIFVKDIPADTNLEVMMAKIFQTTLPQDRPLWCCWVLRQRDGASPQDIILVRIHHSIGDGLALCQLIGQLFDYEARVATPELPGSMSEHLNRHLELSGEGRRKNQRMLGNGKNPIKTNVVATAPRTRTSRPVRRTRRKPKRCRLVRAVLYFLWFSICAPFSLIAVLWLKADARSPFRDKKIPVGKEKCISWGTPIELKRMKETGLALGATVNDVILACAAGALRRFMIQKGQKPRDLKVIVPVSLRKIRTKKVVLDNRVSAVFLHLPISQADPVRRLKKLKARMDSLKRSPQAFVIYFLIRLMTKIVPASWSNGIQRHYYGKCSLCLTNVPGPRQRYNFGGGKVNHMYPWVPLVGDGQVGFCCFSYAGYVTTSVVTDRKCIQEDDIRMLCGYYGDAFKEIEEGVKKSKGGDEL